MFVTDYVFHHTLALYPSATLNHESDHRECPECHSYHLHPKYSDLESVIKKICHRNGMDTVYEYAEQMKVLDPKKYIITVD